jgi:hypothetical protein
MSAIATSSTGNPALEAGDQHSIGRTLTLHILPGVFILALFVASTPFVMRAGFPPMLAVSIGAAFGLSFQLWHLYREGRKRNKEWSLDGIVLYRKPMPVWQYFVMVPLFVVLGFLIDRLTAPLSPAFLSSLPWLPEWFEMRDPGQLFGYSRTALQITFGVYLLINGFAAPIVEELYFRGYLMPRLSHFGRWTPVVESALFSLYHFWQPYYWVSQFIAVLPYVSAVYWKQNVRLGILVHMILNLLGGLLLTAMILGQM